MVRAPALTFALRMALRELRAAWRRLLFFFICVSVGVGTIVALRSVVQSVHAAIAREARSLIAADVLIQTNRPWTDDLRSRVADEIGDVAAEDLTEAVETATMVRPTDPGKLVARMAELRAVQPGFPLRGTIVLEDRRPYTHALLANRGALVRPELLAQLDLAVGDTILIGRETFTIRGVIAGEPGRRLGTFSFGPRVLIDYADLEATGLLGFGSRASYQVMVRVPDERVEPLVLGIREAFTDQYVTARSYRSTGDAISDDLTRAEDYLSLIGFVMVVVGGIGVWSVTRVFVEQKIKTVAILKGLGASTRQVIGAYLTQALILGAGGSLLGVGLARLALVAIPESLTRALGQVEYGLTASAIAQGVGVGTLVSLLFALAPLLEVRRVKPLFLMRPDMLRTRQTPAHDPHASWWRRAASKVHADRLQIGVAALVALALLGLAVWQGGSWEAGLVLCSSLAGAAIVLHLAGAALVRLVRPLARTRWFPLRHAVISLSRPGNQTRVVLLAVGLGSFFVIGVRALEANLLRELALELRADSPDLFLIDIQPDQEKGVDAFVQQVAVGRPARLLPVLRARVTGVRGRDLTLESFDDVRGRGSLAREYVITYRDHLEPNERIIEGRFWADADGPSAEEDPSGASAVSEDASGAGAARDVTASAEVAGEVSIEESLRDRFGIRVGDFMRFDIVGRILQVRVTSIRRVDWSDSRNGGFMFVFSPEALEGAPRTFIALLQGPRSTAARARFQRELVERYPNVSVIDIREVVQTIQAVVGNVTLAITVVGVIALLCGGLILVGSVAMTKFQRIYEVAIFKTLGAGRRTVAAMLLLEYGTLGTLAGTIGAVGAIGLSWALCRFLLEIPWSPMPGLSLAGIAVTAVLVGIIGVVASLDVLLNKPLSTLRAE